MKFLRIPTATLCAAFILTSFNVKSDPAIALALAPLECAPQVNTLLTTNAVYKSLNARLSNNTTVLKTLLDQVKDQTSYKKLLDSSRLIASFGTTPPLPGRLVITAADGTVVVDTGKPDDPNNLKPLVQGNSYVHFLNKTVNENHNSRIAILDAQLQPCGKGVETKFSTSDGTKESYVAIRLGDYLNSSGTARLSLKTK
jgi:hypothetical protein